MAGNPRKLIFARVRQSGGKSELKTLWRELGIKHRLTNTMPQKTNWMVEPIIWSVSDGLKANRINSELDLQQNLRRYNAVYIDRPPNPPWGGNFESRPWKTDTTVRPFCTAITPYELLGNYIKRPLTSTTKLQCKASTTWGTQTINFHLTIAIWYDIHTTTVVGSPNYHFHYMLNNYDTINVFAQIQFNFRQ